MIPRGIKCLLSHPFSVVKVSICFCCHLLESDPTNILAL